MGWNHEDALNIACLSQDIERAVAIILRTAWLLYSGGLHGFCVP